MTAVDLPEGPRLAFPPNQSGVPVNLGRRCEGFGPHVAQMSLTPGGCEYLKTRDLEEYRGLSVLGFVVRVGGVARACPQLQGSVRGSQTHRGLSNEYRPHVTNCFCFGSGTFSLQISYHV